MILALETSTEVCSLAYKDKAGTIHEKRSIEQGKHAERMFLYLKEIVEEHELDFDLLKAVLISAGPGSFTGLRISASGVKGILYDRDIPLYALDTLAGLAMSAVEAGNEVSSVHSVIDARRQHLYHRRFEWDSGKNLFTHATPARVVSLDRLNGDLAKGEVIIGTGIERLSEETLNRVRRMGPEYITARGLIKLFELWSENSSSVPDDQIVRKTSVEDFAPDYYPGNDGWSD